MILTRDDILKIEAGREIDALVAELVMGWTNCQRCEYAIRLLDETIIIEGKVWIGNPPLTGIEQDLSDSFSPRWYPIRNYSTDLTTAFQIVGKLIKPDWAWKIESYHVNGILMWSACYRGDTEAGIDYYTATADTVQLAICKAALYTML